MDWATLEGRVIAAVLIGGLSAFAGFVSRHWIEAIIRSKSSSYLSAIIGTWKGSFTQQLETLETVQIEVVLNVRFNVIFGTVTYDKSSPLASTTLKCVGGIIKDRYISLYYENERSSMLQHGTIILLLSGNNERLTGSFLGVGPLYEKIVSGTVELEKP